MNYVSTPSRKNSWHGRRSRVSVLAEMALRKELIAERLAELRGTRGQSQEQAAAFVGITVRQWQRWEAGESVPYPRNLEVVASRYGISVAEFFDGPSPVPTDDAMAELLERQNANLERQSEILEELRGEVTQLRSAQQDLYQRMDALAESMAALAEELVAARRARPGRHRAA
jgi:transcriptional regulator with XRE-family HTH domain